MRIEEAIVRLLSTEGRGMTAETLPVGTNQIWAVVFRNPEMFVRDGKLIRLMV